MTFGRLSGGRSKVAEKDLRLTSHKVKNDLKDIWWYEENYGFQIFIAATEGVIEIKIPWNSIRAALKRKDKK
ncbi:MAG: hypothetical protein A2W23_06545 [Planctomycetes bacterium RBG_16_43_13]|nr:MAG: hypothetical protein A2W23_06545 [Planctomycetes bacterium RBG_16_43_13]